jgi:hypothetical protein
MALNIGKEIAALSQMTVPKLRSKYAEAFGESTKSRHKQFLIRRIIWRLQANEEGDLSARARARAKELAAESDVRLTAPTRKPSLSNSATHTAAIRITDDERLPLPGTILARRYKGESVEVRVLPRGFEFEGEIYRSLSAVASKVTGGHWNGYRFFHIGKKGDAHVRESA